MISRAKTRLRPRLWVLLLPLPAMVGHAESGDPLKTMSQISNSAAKGDRLPIASGRSADWTACPPTRVSQTGVCSALIGR